MKTITLSRNATSRLSARAARLRSAFKRRPRRSATAPESAHDVIPIFFTLDDAYAPWLGIAINSIVRNADPHRRYCIVVLHEGLSAEHVRRVKHIVAGTPFEVRFVPMDGKIEGIHDRMGNRLRADYFTLTIFFRLFIPEMFPEWDKGIYLDSDVVVPGDISQLYDFDLGENLIGACRDLSIVDIPPFVDYVDNAVGVGIDNYVNSGILLMNMKALREAGLERRFLELHDAYQFDSVAPDQDYLNVLCHGKILYLPNEWDTMPAKDVPEDPSPKLIHYNLFMKPWCYDDIPYASYFWEYAATSGFEQDARAFKAAYPDEQKEQDALSLVRMTDRATMITGTENTFASVFNTGKEARL